MTGKGCTTAAAAIAAALYMPDLTLAQTGDTRTIQVTANVRGSCRFDTTPNINFGDLDPAAAADREQSIDISFKCTKGVAYQFTVGDGQNFSAGRNRMKNAAGTEYIPYDITPKTFSGAGVGFGTLQTLQIKGTVKAPDYQNVGQGAYSDIVTLSIQP